MCGCGCVCSCTPRFSSFFFHYLIHTHTNKHTHTHTVPLPTIHALRRPEEAVTSLPLLTQALDLLLELYTAFVCVCVCVSSPSTATAAAAAKEEGGEGGRENTCTHTQTHRDAQTQGADGRGEEATERGTTPTHRHTPTHTLTKPEMDEITHTLSHLLLTKQAESQEESHRIALSLIKDDVKGRAQATGALGIANLGLSALPLLQKVQAVIGKLK